MTLYHCFLFPAIKLVDGVFLNACNVCRFDSEQTQAQEEVQREKSQREKLSREKDMLTGEVFSLRQQLEVSNLSFIIRICCLSLRLFLAVTYMCLCVPSPDYVVLNEFFSALSG